MLRPQQEIELAFIRGEALTVVTAREKYHTTELRKVVTRLQKCFGWNGQHIHSEHIQGPGGLHENFKTYWLKKTPWELCFCHKSSLVKI